MRRAFSLVELVMAVTIIGIVAAIAVPRMSNVSTRASANALQAMLTNVRKAIDCYYAEHDKYPGYDPATEVADGDQFVDQLLMYSNARGETNATYGYSISGVVLSPMSNPFEPDVTNPKGIYVIDVLGSRLRIEDSRIVGTLVILNGSAFCSYVQGAVNWEPAVSNLPVLLVQGPLCLYMDGTAPLDEKTLHANFNPEGTPYDGDWNNGTDDTYPSIIKGLVYAESRLDVALDPVVDGVVVSGGIANLTPITVLDLTFERTYLDNPPPGFTAPPRMVISPGMWRQVVD